MGNIMNSENTLLCIEVISIILVLIQFIIFLGIIKVYRSEVKSLNNRNKALMDSNRKILKLEKMYLNIFKNLLIGYDTNADEGVYDFEYIENSNTEDDTVTNYEDLKERLKTL